MIDTTRLTHILRFLETIDQFKTIYRANYLSAQSRHENDAEQPGIWLCSPCSCTKN